MTRECSITETETFTLKTQLNPPPMSRQTPNPTYMTLLKKTFNSLPAWERVDTKNTSWKNNASMLRKGHILLELQKWRGIKKFHYKEMAKI